MYESGLGVEKDLTEARHWYMQAAKGGSKPAQDALARLP